jgi:hypothetical protein
MIKSGRISWTGHVAHMEMKLYPEKVSVRNLEGNESLGRTRGEDNMKWILRNNV